MGDKFQRHSFKVTFKLKVKSVRGHILIFDIFENRIAGYGSYEDLSVGTGAGARPEPQKSFTRSRSWNTSPEPEPDPTKMSRLRVPYKQ